MQYLVLFKKTSLPRLNLSSRSFNLSIGRLKFSNTTELFSLGLVADKSSKTERYSVFSIL